MGALYLAKTREVGRGKEFCKGLVGHAGPEKKRSNRERQKKLTTQEGDGEIPGRLSRWVYKRKRTERGRPVPWRMKRNRKPIKKIGWSEKKKNKNFS